MGIKTQKVLRLISKIILVLVGVAVVGYCGLVVYKSVANRPQKVRVTNITDSAVTITWVTDSPVRGVVYYKTKDTVLPGPFGFLFSNVGYDDRDFAVAQKDCVNAFNENAKNTKDANFAVSGSNFDCENIKVEKLGAYYTHSITLKNLNESSTYFFKVGNGIWSWGINGVGKDIAKNDLPLATKFNFVTGKVPTIVPTPNIAYGNVYAVKNMDNEAIVESTSKDSMVFAYLTIAGVNSQVISTVTNTDGGWILDKSNFRDTDGNLITDLSGAKLEIGAQYENINTPRWLEIEDGLIEDTNVDLQGNLVDDLTPYQKSKALELFDSLVEKVYAVAYNAACHTDCGGPEAPSCTAGEGCVKKCYNKCVGESEWVSTGGKLKAFGEAASAPNCAMPSGCGCTPGQCEENCDNKTRKTCMSGHYWSVWVAGSCTPTKCSSNEGSTCIDDNGATVSEGSICSNGKKCEGGECNGSAGGGLKCEDDNGALVNEGKVCSNGKLCKDGECNGENNNAGDCTAANYTYGCYSGTIGDNKSKKCLKNGNVFNWKEYNDDYCVGGNSCTVPTTCTKNAGTSKYEKCEAGVLKDYGKDDSNCDGKTDVQCKATVKYYDTPGYDNNQCSVYSVKSCTLTCGSEVTVINSPAKCLSQFGFDKKTVCGDENGTPTGEKDIDINEVDINAFGEDELVKLLSQYPSVRGVIESALNGNLKKVDNRNCEATDIEKPKTFNQADKFCRVLTGNNTERKSLTKRQICQGNLDYNDYSICPPVYTKKINFISPIFAQDNESDGYTLYLPEYGMYSFELGDYNLTTDTNNGNTYYIFYIEANGKDGFQMPADPDNPTAEEDVMLKSNSAAITYEKLSSAQKYTIAKGINIVSFDFVPVATDLGAYNARDVVLQAKKDGVNIKYIASFDGGRWSEGYSCITSPCSGTNFTIVPGKGYLIYAIEGGDMTIPGYTLTSGVPVAFSAGWNLIGVHGYTTAYTARSFIDSINTITGLTANNVSWWPTSKSKYEGIQVDSGTQYGLDFSISPTNGYFVRISNFAPSDTKCKSLIWQIGGTLNGTCGNTK